MSWAPRGNNDKLIDYAKKPETDLGKVKYDQEKYWKGGSGKGAPASNYDGQTDGSGKKY